MDETGKVYYSEMLRV